MFRENLQQIEQQLSFRRKRAGLAGMHVFEGGAPAGSGFAALEANEISMIVFIHIHSVQFERHMIVIWMF